MAKTIIITGAGRGVGKSCAERFLKEGWSVGLIGRTEPLDELEKMRENAMALPCDVADSMLLMRRLMHLLGVLDGWTPCLTMLASPCQANQLTKSMLMIGDP